MGSYVNPGNAAFREAVNSRIYVDKSGLISYTNSVLSTMQKNVCVSRPRRFGKSMAADMLVAYYSKGCDSCRSGRFLWIYGEKVAGLFDEWNVDFSELQKWYDGYVLNGVHIYNPESVVDVMRWKNFKSYWTGTETYEALKIYIDQNFDGLKEAVIRMLGNGRCKN